MCRLDSSFCSLLSLEGGTILIAWFVMSVATIFAATEVVNPWIYAMYSLENSKNLTRFFLGECVVMAFASIFLLIAVHENRPMLCMLWLFFVVSDMVAIFGMMIYLMPKDIPYAILHSEAVSIHIAILAYFVAVVMSYYYEQQDESASLTDLRG